MSVNTTLMKTACEVAARFETNGNKQLQLILRFFFKSNNCKQTPANQFFYLSIYKYIKTACAYRTHNITKRERGNEPFDEIISLVMLGQIE